MTDDDVMCKAKIEGVCQGRAVHSHHRKTRARGGSNDPVNLVRLCHACHDWVHGHSIAATEMGLLLHAWDDETPL